MARRIDQCRADYAQWQRYTEPCTWYAGEPHNKTMTGRDIWRRLKTVSAGGESYGAPEFISTSCWGGAAPALPAVPSVTTTTAAETRTNACGQYEVGSGRDYRRTRTRRETFFSWDDNPFIKVSYTNWILSQNQCTTAMCNEGGQGGSMVPCESLEEEEGDSGPGGGGEGGCCCQPDYLTGYFPIYVVMGGHRFPRLRHR